MRLHDMLHAECSMLTWASWHVRAGATGTGGRQQPAPRAAADADGDQGAVAQDGHLWHQRTAGVPGAPHQPAPDLPGCPAGAPLTLHLFQVPLD